MKEKDVEIVGMHCGGCVKSVTRAIESVQGVDHAEVSLEKKEAKIFLKDGEVSPEAIKHAVEEAGYGIIWN